MTTSVKRGSPTVLLAEWRLFAGGPYVAMSSVTITITSLAGSVVLATTATGVQNPATGIYAYTWTPSGALPLGGYLVEWSGTDPDTETVGASEIIDLADVVAAPLGGPYASLAELKAWIGIPDSKTDRDAELTRRLASSAEDINRWCHRQFGRTDVATLRSFRPGRTGVDVDDFWTADDLAITPYLGQTAGTAWDVTTLTLEPLDGVVDGVEGWPYSRLCSGWSGHPLVAQMFYTASTVKVMAKWGWAAVPSNVNTANLILAAADNKAKDTPFGVAGFGDYAVRIRSNPIAQEKLDPYVRYGTTASSLMVG